VVLQSNPKLPKKNEERNKPALEGEKAVFHKGGRMGGILGEKKGHANPGGGGVVKWAPKFEQKLPAKGGMVKQGGAKTFVTCLLGLGLKGGN